jgi:GAF domain-containing protein
MTERNSSRDEAAGPPPAAGENADLLTRFQAARAGVGPQSAQDRRDLPDRLCHAVREVLPVDGAAISVYLGADIAVPVGVSDADAAHAESLQFTLREGPCLSAYTSGKPVAVPDIDQFPAPAPALWPTYTAELAGHTPYRSVFAYPLLLGGSAVGSLSVYQRVPGRPGTVPDLTALAAVITTSLLDAETFAGLHGEPEHPWIDGARTAARQQVWLAQGMIMEKNRLNPAQSLELMRALAYTGGRLIDAVAADIAAGNLPIPVLDSSQ